MPILNDKKADQEWLKRQYEHTTVPSHFFDYEEYIRYFCKINLNYFEGQKNLQRLHLFIPLSCDCISNG